MAKVAKTAAEKAALKAAKEAAKTSPKAPRISSKGKEYKTAIKADKYTWAELGETKKGRMNQLIRVASRLEGTTLDEKGRKNLAANLNSVVKRNGYIDTTPSESAVYSELVSAAKKAQSALTSKKHDSSVTDFLMAAMALKPGSSGGGGRKAGSYDATSLDFDL